MTDLPGLRLAGDGDLPSQPGPAQGWSRPLWLAIAAVLGLAAGAAIFAPWSSQNQTAPPGGQIGSTPRPAGLSATRLVSYVSNQHDKCANLGAYFEDKFISRTPAEAQATAVELLDQIPRVIDLHGGELVEMGYTFAGLGPCGVPGKGKSVHLLYTSQESGAPPISLFIKQDTHDMDEMIVKPKTCYGVVKCEDTGRGLSVWREGGLIYYLFTPTLDLHTPAKSAVGAPTVEANLL